ncbi:MAG: hypothetical protein KDC98_11020 [Planctomycetes bacterium]|nr:hypothetical protein [Planctomycetota bacterium]
MPPHLSGPCRALPLALILFAALRAQEPATRTGGDAEGRPTRATAIERHGIRWRFDREHTVGTFANGDPWVTGPVRIIEITPGSVEVDGRVMHGSMVDPDPSQMLQGYDSRLFGDKDRERYRGELNVAFGISAENPLVLEAGTSLVSVRSRDDAAAMPQLLCASVLTCLALRPPPDSFRPPYVRGDKAMPFRAADLDLTLLEEVRPTVDTPPIEVIAARFERLWLDHFPEWPVRYAHPFESMPDYGRDIGAQIGSGALALQFDVGLEKKRTLAIRMTQIGLDLFACLRGGCRWEGIGGHGHGRKLPILLAGSLLHDEAMLAIGHDYVSELQRPGAGTHYFAEDGQTFYVEETSPGIYNWGHGGYRKEHVGLAEWGFNHVPTVASDDVVWEANPYRRCCTANGWVAQCLAVRMMGLRQAWHHEAFFDYMDRYMKVDHTDSWHRAWIGWHASMWDAYRSNY